MAVLNKNKAMIPMDCSRVVYRQGLTAFSSLNSNTIKDINLSISSDVSTLTRPFDLVGGFHFECGKVNISHKAGVSSRTYYLKCRLKFDNNTKNRFQFIRFTFEPGITFKNTGKVTCKFGIDIYININGVDKKTIRLESNGTIAPNLSYSTGIYKFIYDIENNIIESDIYE